LAFVAEAEKAWGGGVVDLTWGHWICPFVGLKRAGVKPAARLILRGKSPK